MIIADLTIWSAALQGRARGFDALLGDLLARGGVTSPGVVFAQLLLEAESPELAPRLRAWAAQVPAVVETRGSWVAAGDLAAHLADDGDVVHIADAAVLALCLREGWSLWTLNPRLDAAARSLGVQRYAPQGV